MNWTEIYEKSDIKTLKQEMNRLLVTKEQFKDNEIIVLELTSRITFLMLLIMDKKSKIIN